MKSEKKIPQSLGPLDPEAAVPEGTAASLPLEQTEKGSFWSMWELLMQLRVLLPYLTRLVPLLDRGLLKATPDLTEVRKGIEEVHTGNRDLGVQLRNQAVQMERLEEQVSRLREANERVQKDLRDVSTELHALGHWIKPLFIVSAITLVALLALGVFLLAKVAH
jgi:hypothetical protein